MQCLGSYRLEAALPIKKFSACEIISILLYLTAILLLIMLIEYFYIAIGVVILGFLVTLLKPKTLYKYIYEMKDGRLTILADYGIKSIICEELSVKNDIACYKIKDKIANVDETVGNKRYYSVPTDITAELTLQDGRVIGLAIDAYFYALLEYYFKTEVKE